MTKIKANIKEAAGYVEEEAAEAFNAPQTAAKGRELRNEGRIEKGKMPKLTTPGTTAN